MSKPIKELIIGDYRRRFQDLEGALVLDLRGIDANQTNALRYDLRAKAIRVTIVKNTLARAALAGTGLEALGPMLEGPSALAYGADSVVDVARELVAWARKIEHLTLRAAVLDGQLFEGLAAVKQLSQFPTRTEARARIVQLVLSPARTVMGCAGGPGGRILGIVKQVQERLERGQAIARV